MDNTDKMVLDLIAKRKQKKKRTIIIVVASFAALIIIGAFIPKDEQKEAEKQEQEIGSKVDSYKIEARLKAEEVAKSHATNPDEAEFENQQVQQDGLNYICTGTIISKNDFGVKKRAKYHVKLFRNTSNNQFEVKDNTVYQ